MLVTLRTHVHDIIAFFSINGQYYFLPSAIVDPLPCLDNTSELQSDNRCHAFARCSTFGLHTGRSCVAGCLLAPVTAEMIQ